MLFSDITEDGTYFLDSEANVHRMSIRRGYTVAIRPIDVDGAIEVTNLNTGTIFGKWTHPVSGIVYWDEVEVIDSLLEAGNVARQRGELAIWDNFNNREFFV